MTDMFITLARDTQSTGQIMALTALFGGVIFVLMVWRRGERMFHRQALNLSLNLRSLGEVVGSFSVIIAFGLLDFSTVVVIAQAHPLAVTLGAAVFLGEAVGWRRWVAIFLGFIGVLIVMRPTPESFDPNLLWTVVYIAGFTMRDLASRTLPREISTVFAVAWSMVALAIVGSIIMIFTSGFVMPDALNWVWLFGASIFLALAVWLLTNAMRIGEVSAIAPFRYARIPFALLAAWIIFADVPDLLTWVGCAVIAGSGGYAFWRERRLSAVPT